MDHLRQRGFTIVEVFIVLLIAVVIVAGTYFVFKSRNADSPAAKDAAATGAVNAEDVPAAPEVKTTADLDTSTNTLDQAQLDGSDDSALDAQADGF